MEMSNFFNENISFICPIQFQEIHEGVWSLEEEKMFENALAFFDLNSCDIFEKIADILPGKSIDQVKIHFDELVHDLKLIETSRIGVPPSHNFKPTKKKMTCGPVSNNKEKITSSNHPSTAKKGARWTKEEHERFLVGLNKYGKGDWRNISRNCVLTKTPTQVASHAQKYFIRLAKSTSSSTISATIKPPHKLPTFQETTGITALQSSWVTGAHHLDVVVDPPNKTKTSA